MYFIQYITQCIKKKTKYGRNDQSQEGNVTHRSRISVSDGTTEDYQHEKNADDLGRGYICHKANLRGGECDSVILSHSLIFGSPVMIRTDRITDDIRLFLALSKSSDMTAFLSSAFFCCWVVSLLGHKVLRVSRI